GSPRSDSGPGLSLLAAVASIVAAAVVGNVLLGLGGLIGADARVPTMVLMRAPLGRRGSYLPTALNIAQCLGWSVFELIIIATGASALSEQLFGIGGVAFWEILFGGIAPPPAFPRPVRVGRRDVRKFAGRVRAQVRPKVRRLDRRRVAALPLLVVAARPAAHRALASRRRPQLLARVRSRARVGDQLDAAGRGLHPLRPFAQGRVLGNGC